MLLIYFVLSLFCRGNALGSNEMQMVLSHIHELQQASLFWTLEYYLVLIDFPFHRNLFHTVSFMTLLFQKKFPLANPIQHTQQFSEFRFE